MIDNFTILFTTMVTVYVVWRASRLDRSMPWFPPAPEIKEEPVVPSRWSREQRLGLVPPAGAGRWSGTGTNPGKATGSALGTKR